MSDLEKRLHRVMGSLIGNESLAVSLDDDAAGELLLWGKTAAQQIVAATDGLDDESADEKMAAQLRALRLLLRAIGRWVGEADVLDVESRRALWVRAGDQAQILFGESFEMPSMEDALERLPVDFTAQQVIAWLKTFIEERG